MSAVKEALRSVRVFNDHEFFDGSDGVTSEVYVSYTPSFARSPVGAYWAVYRRGYRTDKDGPWYYHGSKGFSAYGREGKKAALVEAQEWARGRYGIAEWKRTPFGGYGEKSFVERRLRELRAAAKPEAAA